ncbi:MAG: peptidyl-prolyl cis-trans isomerase, partial [Proteobacteria bacterium]|nr:peptidyl-prolyl cis-trans isomerase [Pseudomonadota bacterium]
FKSTAGYYIIALTDRRKILTSEPLDELLDLKQIGYFFNQETSEEKALAWFDDALLKTAELNSCADLTDMVNELGEVLYRDLGEISLKQLNPDLRKILMPIAVGQATKPINTPDGFIIFAICNRRMPDATLPSPDEIRNQIETQRIAMMGRRYLRDLRRDAIIDYR